MTCAPLTWVSNCCRRLQIRLLLLTGTKRWCPLGVQVEICLEFQQRETYLYVYIYTYIYMYMRYFDRQTNVIFKNHWCFIGLPKGLYRLYIYINSLFLCPLLLVASLVQIDRWIQMDKIHKMKEPSKKKTHENYMFGFKSTWKSI